MPTIGGKKISLPLFVFAACVLGIGLGLFGFNVWHTNKCSGSLSQEDVDEHIAALNRRLLESESKVIKNELLMNKILSVMQSELLKLEDSEYRELSSKSEDEAVRIALFLAAHPAPPMPIFPLDSKYMDAESLANTIDDVFGRTGDDKYEREFQKEYESEFSAEKDHAFFTDSEAIVVCTEMKTKYNVLIGVSWGDLPFDLQQKWVTYSCDYHLGEASPATAEEFLDDIK